jgi:hypothetical protein
MCLDILWKSHKLPVDHFDGTDLLALVLFGNFHGRFQIDLISNWQTSIACI